jgi:hypothetical protein
VGTKSNCGSPLIHGAKERQRESLASGLSAVASAKAEAARSYTANPPVDWDPATGRNIVWSVELGRETYGRPVVAGDAVYVGTDNARHRNPTFEEDAGVLVAFDAKDGAFLWQDAAPRVERGLREWLLPSTTSAPYVEGDRLYYVTAECQLRSLGTQGHIVWQLDMPALGVFPHEACNSEVVPVGDLLMDLDVQRAERRPHARPIAAAPSLIAVDKRSGDGGLARHRRGRERTARPVVQPCGGQRQWTHTSALRRRRWLAARVRRGVGQRSLAI